MLLHVNGALYHPLYMYIYLVRKHVLKRGRLGQSQVKERCITECIFIRPLQTKGGIEIDKICNKPW